MSGLCLNRKKTEVLWIGAKAGSENKLCPEIELKWMRDKIRTLGAWLSTERENKKNKKNKKKELPMKANYNETLTKLKVSLGYWELRRLSLLGKITVLKSLIISQLVYILYPG